MNDPIDILLDSFEQALAVEQHNNARYATLTTLDESGFPVSRTVTIREMTREGIAIYISEQSPKMTHLRLNSIYELLLFWPSLLRQFRLRGRYEVLSSESQREAWRKKTYAGKLYDLFQAFEQPQSSILPSREAYLARAEGLRARFPEQAELAMPEVAVTLRLIPDYVESWFASMEDGLHDRRLFRLMDGQWIHQVLVP